MCLTFTLILSKSGAEGKSFDQVLKCQYIRLENDEDPQIKASSQGKKNLDLKTILIWTLYLATTKLNTFALMKDIIIPTFGGFV